MIERLIAQHPQAQGRAARPPRHEFVERRRQDLLRDGARDHRSRRRVHRASATAAIRRSAGRSTRRSPRRSGASILAEILPWLRGQISATRRFVATVQDDERMLRFVNSDDAPRLAALGTSCPDHFLRTKIKPLFVDWDPAERRRRGAEGGIARGSRRVPPGLRRLLRPLQAARLAADARPQPDRDPDSRAGHDRLGQEQERVARDRRVLQLRHRGDARRGGHRPVRGHGPAGGLRHRILARSRRRSSDGCRPRRSSTAR